MRKLIQDEFTDLPISKERKRQLRMRRDNPEKYREYIQKRSKSNQWDYVKKNSSMLSNQFAFVGGYHTKRWKKDE